MLSADPDNVKLLFVLARSGRSELQWSELPCLACIAAGPDGKNYR